MIIKSTLNTTNPEYFSWQFEQLQIAVLGGVKIAGLDRMKVTVKVSWKQLSIRHNLDLYNDNGLDKLVKRCAERFGLGTAYFAGVFARW
jgi:hypothetical protein